MDQMARAAKTVGPAETKAGAKPSASATKQAKGRAATRAAGTSARRVPESAAPATLPAKAPVVTLKHLAAGVAEAQEMPKRDAEAFAASLIGELVAQIKGGAKVRIAGLGVIEIKDRPARMGRNPATGEALQITASRKLVFRPAKELKEAI